MFKRKILSGIMPKVLAVIGTVASIVWAQTDDALLGKWEINLENNVDAIFEFMEFNTVRMQMYENGEPMYFAMNYSIENGNMKIGNFNEFPYSGGDVLEMGGISYSRVGNGNGIVGTWSISVYAVSTIVFTSDGKMQTFYEGAGKISELDYSYSDGIVKVGTPKIVPYSITQNPNTLITVDYPMPGENVWKRVEEDTPVNEIVPHKNKPLFKSTIVSDKMELTLDEMRDVRFVVYDMTGNIVADGNGKTWDLRNSAGRFVANGAYLVVVEATDRNGEKFRWSDKLGVKR